MKVIQCVSIVLGILVVFNVTAEENLTDPYEILNKHYEAIGGLEKLKAIETIYIEGKISMVGTGLEGTFKQWMEKPLKERQEVDLAIIKQVSGDNGEYKWTVDSNGKVQWHKDEQTMKAREAKKLQEEYDHLDPDSPNFDVIFQGIEKVGETDCYKIKTISKIDESEIVEFFNVSNFYLEKSIIYQDNLEIHSLSSDYRDVGNGTKTPFLQEQTILPIGQRQLIEIQKFEPGIEMDDAIFEPVTEDVQDFEFENGQSAEDIPFQFLGNHIYLTVNLDGEEGLWVLDTGAGKSVIDKGCAEKLGLKMEGNLKGQGVGKTIDVTFTELPPFSMDGLSFSEQQIVATDISWLLKSAMGIDVIGILGYDFLSRLVTKVDYANEKISFYHPEKFEYTGEGKVLDAHLNQNILTAPMIIDGKYSGVWRFDLGASGLSFHYPFAEENGLLELPGTQRIAFGAGGKHVHKIVKFKTAEMGGFVVEEPIISIPTEKGEGAFATKDFIGNIGNDFLRHFVVYLDYENQQIILEKGDDFSVKFPEDRSGLQISYDENEDIVVLAIPNGTPAEESGFVEGDILQTINGIKVENFESITGIRKMFKEESGKKYEIEVLRDGKVEKLELILRDLY